MLHTTLHRIILAGAFLVPALAASATEQPRRLFVDVHELGAGQVTAEAVAAAHKLDLAVQSEFDTRFLKYWVDEEGGRVLCLSEAPDARAVTETHRAAHGLLPASVHSVSEGEEATALGDFGLYLDVHHLGPGAVTAEAVAEAHVKDLEVQSDFDVRFLNYWVDEEKGMVWCLSEAPDANAVRETHAEAHGLLPEEILRVVQGE